MTYHLDIQHDELISTMWILQIWLSITKNRKKELRNWDRTYPLEKYIIKKEKKKKIHGERGG